MNQGLALVLGSSVQSSRNTCISSNSVGQLRLHSHSTWTAFIYLFFFYIRERERAGCPLMAAVEKQREGYLISWTTSSPSPVHSGGGGRKKKRKSHVTTVSSCLATIHHHRGYYYWRTVTLPVFINGINALKCTVPRWKGSEMAPIFNLQIFWE